MMGGATVEQGFGTSTYETPGDKTVDEDTGFFRKKPIAIFIAILSDHSAYDSVSVSGIFSRLIEGEYACSCH